MTCNCVEHRLQTRVACLEKQQQLMSREAASQPNMTYVRNVLLKMIETKDKKQKDIMLNALLTALTASSQLGEPSCN